MHASVQTVQLLLSHTFLNSAFGLTGRSGLRKPFVDFILALDGTGAELPSCYWNLNYNNPLFWHGRNYEVQGQPNPDYRIHRLQTQNPGIR